MWWPAIPTSCVDQTSPGSSIQVGGDTLTSDMRKADRLVMGPVLLTAEELGMCDFGEHQKAAC